MQSQNLPSEQQYNSQRIITILIDLLGHGAYLSWAFIMSWGSCFNTGLVAFSGDQMMALRLLMFAGVLAAVLLYRIFNRSIRRIPFIVLVLVTILTSTPSILAALYALQDSMLMFISWFISGIGQVTCLYIWRRRLLVIDWQNIAVVLIGSLIMASLMIMLISNFEGVLGYYIIVALPILSVLLLCNSIKRQSVDNSLMYAAKQSKTERASSSDSMNEKSSAASIHKRRNAFIGVYSVAFGFATCSLTTTDFIGESNLFIALANIAAGIFMIYVFTKSRIDFSRLLPALFLPVSAISYMGFSSISNNVIQMVFIALLFFLFACYDILNGSAMYVGTGFDSDKPALNYSRDRMGNAIGYLLGWLVGYVALVYLKLDVNAFGLLCFILVVVFIIANTILFESVILLNDSHIVDTKNIYKSENVVVEVSHQGQGRWKLACENVALKYHLTPRQTEIMFMLAKGRTVQHISEKLYLSNHTVKSHVYSLYQKLGIHTKQELIDVIENS